jgi:hypothetical protein
MNASGAILPRLHLLRDVLKAVLSVLLVFGAAAVLLDAVDAVPGLVTGEPRHVRRARTVDDVERRLRTRLLLPYYFPSTLRWPPERIRFTIDPPGAALGVDDARDGTPQIFVAQAIGAGPIPDRLIPAAQVLQSSPVWVNSERGVLSRVVVDGLIGWEVRWQQSGRRLLVRSRGTVEELLRMARSVREAP